MASEDRKLVLVWAGLVILTIASFEGGWAVPWLARSGWSVTLVMVVALIKVRMVVLDFMEVRHAPWALRAPLECWMLAIGVGILGLWYFGPV